MKKHVIVSLLVACTIVSFKSEDTGTVILARKALWSGAAGATKIFMDDKIICELSNNAFSTHQVPEGKHTFYAKWYSKNSKGSDKEKEIAIELEITPGQTYYLQVIREDKGMNSKLILQEITANTWTKTKVGLEEDDCH